MKFYTFKMMLVEVRSRMSGLELGGQILRFVKLTANPAT